MDSAIAPTYNLRPEQKLQNHTEYPKHDDQFPSARTHPEPVESKYSNVLKEWVIALPGRMALAIRYTRIPARVTLCYVGFGCFPGNPVCSLHHDWIQTDRVL